MKNAIRKPYRGHVFRMAAPLAEPQLDQLIACFRAEAAPSPGTLGGRRQMPSVGLGHFGRVVVKCYRRGGLIGRFNHRYYIKGRATRSEMEFEWLNRVRMQGVKAPEPIAAVHRGGLFYRCWLVTREVTGATSLAELSVKRPESLEVSGACCRRQVDILVANGILHPDLHPGNVLVDPEGQAWFIDFDKARYYRGRRPRLAARYHRRWHAALRKHGLPPELAAMMPAHLYGRNN